MNALVGWCWFSYGIVLVMTSSKPTAFLRRLPFPFGDLFKCPMCFGWWVGLAIATLLPMLAGPSRILIGQPSRLADAFMCSAWCWFVHVVLSKLGAREL